MLKQLMGASLAAFLAGCAAHPLTPAQVSNDRQLERAERDVAVFVKNPGSGNCLPTVLGDRFQIDSESPRQLAFDRSDLFVRLAGDTKVSWRLFGEPDKASVQIIPKTELNPFSDCVVDPASGALVSVNKQGNAVNQPFECTVKFDRRRFPPKSLTTFTYAVKVSGCANALDPRVYIRGMNR